MHEALIARNLKQNCKRIAAQMGKRLYIRERIRTSIFEICITTIVLKQMEFYNFSLFLEFLDIAAIPKF